MKSLIDRHHDNIRGVLGCFDRMVITGTLPEICYAEGMSRYLSINGVRIFDYTQWAEPLRDEIRSNAERIADENGIAIEFVRNSRERKEDIVEKALSARGDHPGLVHILSAMETCATYKPWHDKKTHRTFLKPNTGKCLHYYFYFIDPDLGLCYLRVPTWAPFRLQFYYNGHNELARKLERHGIGYRMISNAFVHIEDMEQAQRLADDIVPRQRHRRLDELVRHYCPIVRHFSSGYHWSIMQAEYATDIIFRRQSDLTPLYDDLVRTMIHAANPERVATFLGRKLVGQYRDELGNDFHTRIEGTCIKHHMGKSAIKMYNKMGMILRIETVSNDVSFFKHHRRVEHRDGTWEMKVAPVRKTIYSLPDLIGLMGAANRRYLDFLSTIDDPSSAIKDLDKVARPARKDERSYRGFNLFHGNDLDLLRTIARGEFNISGFQNKQLRRHLLKYSPGQISQMLKRLRLHGMIKKVANSYKYYLTKLGRRVVAVALKLREMTIIPLLRGNIACPS